MPDKKSLTAGVLPGIVWLLLSVFGPAQLPGQEFVDNCYDCHEVEIEEESIHGGFDCVDCHSLVKQLGEEHMDADFREDPSAPCNQCHGEIAEEYATSIHSQSIVDATATEDAAHCFHCHGSHEIYPASNPKSMVYSLNLAETCGECHANQELVDKYGIPDIHPVEAFSRSYHAKRLVEREDRMAATCNDCHGVHDIKVNTDPTSTISHANISTTCGNCHDRIFLEYKNSVHWKALARGSRESPTCIDCHGEHAITTHDDPNAPVSRRRSAEEVCARCHSNKQLIEKYGLMEGKVSSYQDSYHGLAVMRGARKAATCYDCHNAHEILNEKNTASSIHPDNLVKTCQRCHPGANERFSQSYTHKSVILAEKPVEYYVKIVYYVLIGVVIGGMIIHNGIIFIAFIFRKRRKEKDKDYIQRFTKAEVSGHILLASSFFTLVLTGFALVFTDATWVKLLSNWGLSEALRSLIHRIAAVVMILVSVAHIIQLIFTNRGREFLRTMLPVFGDIRNFSQNMQFHFNKKRRRPKYSRFDYTEKAEYWALIWGTVVMIITGFILWFPTFFAGNTPAWTLKVSEALHYYEAWLAFLAIIVWHLFFVAFHPREYPMSLTWLNGKMSMEEFKHRHTADFESFQEELQAFKDGSRDFKDLAYQTKEYIKRHGLTRCAQKCDI